MSTRLAIAVLALLLAGCAHRGMSAAGPGGSVIDGRRLSAAETEALLRDEGALEALDLYRRACLDSIGISPPHPVLGTLLGGAGGLLGLVAGVGLFAATRYPDYGQDDVMGALVGLGWRLGHAAVGDGDSLQRREAVDREFRSVERLFFLNRRQATAWRESRKARPFP